MSRTRCTVKCPKCSGKAVAVMKPVGVKGTYREPLNKMGAARILCEACGLCKVVSSEESLVYELWYVTQFKRHRLWALNHNHLLFLISWFSGKLKKSDLNIGDRAQVEAFPKWMVKDKAGVLACL